MQRLFYAILVGALLGGAAAVWLTPQQAARLHGLVEGLQARAQAFYAPPRPRSQSPDDVNLGEAEDWPAAVAGDETSPDASPPADSQPPADDASAYERYERRPMTEPAAEAPPVVDSEAVAVPFGDFPRGEESAVLDARINQFESAQIIARIGPDVVLAGEVLPQVNRELAPYEGQVSPAELERARLVLMHRELRELIQNKMLLVEARRRIPAENWKKIEEQVETAFRDSKIPKLMKEHAARDIRDLAAKLQAAGTSLEEERRYYAEKQIAQTWARQNVPPPKEVTYEDLVAYYREHRAEYALEGRARWEQLMIRFDRFPDEETAKEQAFAEIARLGNAILLEGAPFAEVARQHSDGLTAADGGLRDWTTQGSLVSKELDAALFALPIGRLSRIIEDEQGFHIIRVVERQEAGERPFEEVQSEIRATIANERFQEEANKYIARLTEEIPVTTIFDELIERERQQQLSERPDDSPR